jgi:cytochrome bd-type quinol oxidase subunit 1
MHGLLRALAAAPTGAVEDDIDYSAPVMEDLTPAPAFGTEEQSALNPDEVTDNRREPKAVYVPSVRYLETFTALTIVIAFSIVPHILSRFVVNPRISIMAGMYAAVLVSCLLVLTVPRWMRRSVKSKSNASKKMVIMTLITVIIASAGWIVATH